MTMVKSEFDLLRRQVRRLCGIDLGEDKEYLIVQRLEPLLKRYGIATLGELGLKIQSDADIALRDNFISAITTNETSFFRDGHPYDTFRDLLMPRLVELVNERRARAYDRRGAKLSILSAAASTGQEPYSIAMCIHDYLAYRGAPVMPEDFGVVAIDISAPVLARAITGEYTDAEAARGLTDVHKTRHFKRTPGGWAIGNHVKKLVDFRRANLMEPLNHLGGFDLIFCRNVLIYFDLDSRKRIFEQFHQMLSPKGMLILGATENMYGITDQFSSQHIGETMVYSKK